MRYQGTGVALWVLLSIIVACDAGPDDIRIFNATGETVVLVERWQGNEVVAAEIPAEQAYYPQDICIEADLIARDSAGSEIDRRPGPFCRGDAEWVIANSAG